MEQKTLYAIENELLAILGEIEENEGELTSETEASLTIAEEEFKSKLDSYVKAMSVLQGQVDYAESEVKRIKQYIAPKENLIGRLKQKCLDAVLIFGQKDPKKDIYRFETGTFKFGTRKTIATEIYDETQIEDKWKRLAIGNLSLEDKVRILEAIDKGEEEVKISIDILKTPIKTAIEAGEEVKGARLVDNYSLSIK